jgi:hypothetical protein
MGVDRYKAKRYETRGGVSVEAIRLVEGDIDDTWCAVAEFLGLDPNNGRGENFTMRRPPQQRRGCVEVVLHQDRYLGDGALDMDAARFDDWLVRLPSGRVDVFSGDDFDALFGPPRRHCALHDQWTQGCAYCAAATTTLDTATAGRGA